MFKRIYKLLKTYDNPGLWIKNITYRLPSTVSELNVVFVVGSPRSGTTLLQRLLSVHSQFFSIEEEVALFSYQNIFDPARNHFGLARSDIDTLFGQSIDIVDFFSKAVNLLSKRNSGKRFVEKTPQHIFYLPFIFKHFPNAKVIHIVRDGRDCYCSSRKHLHVPQNKSARSFAMYWKKCVSSAIYFEDRVNMFTTKYEDLVRSPQASLQKTMDFLGFQYEENQLNPVIYGADSRAKRDVFRKLAKPIDAASVGNFLLAMSDSERRQFERIAAKQLSSYGYI